MMTTLEVHPTSPDLGCIFPKSRRKSNRFEMDLLVFFDPYDRVRQDSGFEYAVEGPTDLQRI